MGGTIGWILAAWPLYFLLGTKSGPEAVALYKNIFLISGVASFALATIVAPLLPDGALAQEQSRPALTEMSESEREILRTEIRAYLLENPEVLMEAIQILEARREANKLQVDSNLIAQHRDAIFNDGVSFVGGNPDGDVTLVEFSDYRCGYCKRAHPDVQALVESDPNLRLVVKEFPILGPDSTATGRMALAALRLDSSRYEALNDALMTFDGQLTEVVAYQVAAHVGYDIAALKEAAADPEVDAQIAANYGLARTLGLEGTPSFIIGDRIIRGYLPLEALREAVAEARSAIN
jgi:protein-disulfide isomerase